jgi:hypothetical protein
MRLQRLDSRTVDVFRPHYQDQRTKACIGVTEDESSTVRITFDPDKNANILIVGRSRAAAFGICTAMLFDLARQILTTPDRRSIYTTPPLSVLDFSGTEESRIFTNAALSLPLAVKLERATDTAINTLTDLQSELQHRQNDNNLRRHPKFFFLCGLQAAHGLRSRGSYAVVANEEHAKKFRQVLLHGPELSIFTVVWCNSFANVERTMSDGVSGFGRVIELDDADARPSGLSGFGPHDDGVRLLDRSDGRARRFIPFEVPAETWCDEIVRTLS